MPLPLLRARAAWRLLQLRGPWWTSALRLRIGTRLGYVLSTVVRRIGVRDPPLASVGTAANLLRGAGFHQFRDIAQLVWPAASVGPTDYSAVQSRHPHAAGLLRLISVSARLRDDVDTVPKYQRPLPIYAVGFLALR